MSITFFEHSEGSLRKPFIEKYIELHPECIGTEHEVLEISRTRKQTGYMLGTLDFTLFLFEDAKVTGYLLQAMELYVKQQKGYELIIVPDSKHPFYSLGIDENRRATWLYGAGKYTRHAEAGAGLEAVASNPFLPSPTQQKNASHRKQGVSQNG